MFSKNKILCLVIVLVSSCKKGDPEEYSISPVIEFVSISPASISEGQDKITISFRYTDGDGDLGENNADIRNLFVTDNRDGTKYNYRIKELAPRGEAISITGILNAEINNTLITNGASQQPVAYSLYIIDRAGHQSNMITTSEVIIHKP